MKNGKYASRTVKLKNGQIHLLVILQQQPAGMLQEGCNPMSEGRCVITEQYPPCTDYPDSAAAARRITNNRVAVDELVRLANIGAEVERRIQGCLDAVQESYRHEHSPQHYLMELYHEEKSRRANKEKTS